MSFAPRSPAPMPRGERQKHSPYPCPEFERMTIEDNAEQVLRLYDSGVPFFTKEALYELQRQIRNSFPGEIILVKALNGDVEPFENKTGKKLSSYNEPCPPDMEWAMFEPNITYNSIQKLTRVDIPQIDRGGPFASLRVIHCLALRDKLTGEFHHEGPPILPVDSVEELLYETRVNWTGMRECDMLKDILTFEEIPSRINKIIGFGCGSMQFPQKDGEFKEIQKGPLFQHALMLWLRDHLEVNGKAHGEIECYAQDPIYTATDKTVLESADIKVLDDPEAFLEVDSSSVVISCAPDIPVRQIICDIARPAIMIWDRVDNNDDVPETMDGIPCVMTDPESPRVRNMVNDLYKEFVFTSPFKHFSTAVVYVRRKNIPMLD